VRVHTTPYLQQNAGRRDDVGSLLSRLWGSQAWTDSLFLAIENLGADQVSILEEIASNPALDEFAILGGASELDVVSALWPGPYPAGLTAAELPIPRFRVLREGGYAAIVRAAIARREGRHEEAEQILREVIASGVLMARDSPSLIGSLIGAVIASTGGEGLIAFYQSVGRTEEANGFAASLEVARRVSERSNSMQSASLRSSAEALPHWVDDAALPRALRWEAVTVVSAISPCASAGRVLFGPNESFTEWRENARRKLVRFQSEEAFFELIASGLEGSTPDAAPRSWPGRIYAAALGESGSGGCASIFERINTGGL
jgi:hypothetical protein